MTQIEKLWNALVLGSTIGGIVSFGTGILLFFKNSLPILEFILNYPIISLFVALFLLFSIFLTFCTSFSIGFFIIFLKLDADNTFKIHYN